MEGFDHTELPARLSYCCGHRIYLVIGFSLIFFDFYFIPKRIDIDTVGQVQRLFELMMKTVVMTKNLKLSSWFVSNPKNQCSIFVRISQAKFK